MSSAADELVRWAASHGARLHPSVEIYRDSVTGLSFRVKPTAGTAVQPYEPIVHLPTKKLSLSCLNADSAFDVVPATLPPHVVSRLVLIKEFAKGETSFWYPYIRTLPQPGNRDDWALPPFWSDAERALFAATNIEVGIRDVRSGVEAELDLIRSALPDDGDVTADLYHWAFCVFSSRSFRPSLVLDTPRDDFAVLLPLLDVGNHDMTVHVRWEVDREAETCELRVGRVHGPGEQVFINYSPKSNAELLMGYGFMVPTTDSLHNDYVHERKRGSKDEYLVSLRPLTDPSSVTARARQTLHLDLEPGATVLSSLRHVQPEMIWDMACAMTTPEERERAAPVPAGCGVDAEAWQRRGFLTGHLDADDAVGAQTVQRCVLTLQAKLGTELELLENADEHVADDGQPLTRNRQLALDYRSRCRNVLEAVMESIGDEDACLYEMMRRSGRNSK